MERTTGKILAQQKLSMPYNEFWFSQFVCSNVAENSKVVPGTDEYVHVFFRSQHGSFSSRSEYIN
jgi:hypothetical protein